MTLGRIVALRLPVDGYRIACLEHKWHADTVLRLYTTFCGHPLLTTQAVAVYISQILLTICE